MPFISYAQNYEDVILWRALRDVERGFYVDVGAADPEEWSITRAFYDRGWSGINVEPLDEYFNRLVRDRPRDTNLKVAAGREAGLRTLHAIEGTGLSTLDPQTAARQQAAGWQVHDTVVPVLTLAKILEDCGPRSIHFLKIDVEGAEAEVVEGLNLDRVRPWIIIIEATEPSSTVSSRDKWEHLITGRGYGLAYFDGLNCFYVADEVAALKERLAVPPNVFDEFVRFPEWAIRQQAAKLEQEIAGLRGHTGGLEAALQVEQAQTANLRTALQVEQAQTANLRTALQVEQAQTANLRTALQVEQAQTANLRNALQVAQEQTSNLRNALQAEQAQNANLQARLDYLLGRIHQLEAQLAVPSVDRTIGRALRRVRETGDRLTGGGLRSLARGALTTLVQRSMRNRWIMPLGRAVLKPFPKVATTLYQLAIKQNAVAASPVAPPADVLASNNESIPSPAGPPIFDGAATVAALPASARSTYLKLKGAMNDSDAWNRTQ